MNYPNSKTTFLDFITICFGIVIAFYTDPYPEPVTFTYILSVIFIVILLWVSFILFLILLQRFKNPK